MFRTNRQVPRKVSPKLDYMTNMQVYNFVYCYSQKNKL